MKTALIATIGFDEKFCYRAIMRHGIKKGDRVILISGKITDRVEKACDWVKKLLKTSYGDEVTVDFVEIDINSLENSIKTVSSLIEELSNYHIVVNLSGGMRALVIIVLLSCIKTSKDLEIEIETEDFQGLLTISKKLLKLIKNPLPEDKVEILKKIAAGTSDARSLSDLLDRDITTVRRHLSFLKELDLITVEKRKPLRFKITELGKMFV